MQQRGQHSAACMHSIHVLQEHSRQAGLLATQAFWLTVGVARRQLQLCQQLCHLARLGLLRQRLLRVAHGACKAQGHVSAGAGQLAPGN